MKYTKLEYIEGTGTQYIDLGFKLTNNHIVDLDLQIVKLNANIFGSRAGGQDRAFTLFSSTSVIMTDMGSTRNSTSPTTDRINVYLSSSRIKIGTFEKNINSGSFTTPGNGYIFNISYNRPQSYMASMKLYGCKIYLSGTLIRDLVPCKYNNQIGLWDTINGLFLGNAGTGEFVAGPEQGEVIIKYTELEYIESTGTQYIDTGVNNINGVEIQFQYSAYKENASAFGARNGDASDSRFGLTLYDGCFHIMPPGQNVNGIITNKHIFKFGSNVNYQCYMDEELKINKIPTYKSSYNTYLFCECSGGYSSFYSNNLKIYYCKLYKDGVLVRDFIPSKYNGKIGLWDRISETFFINNGTGEFVAGPTIGPKTLKVKTVDKNNIFSKTVSKINGKYAKSINGVSIQCWKKKETNINLVNGAEIFNDDLTILTGKPSSDVAIGSITINDYNTYSDNIKNGVSLINSENATLESSTPINLYKTIKGSIPTQIVTNKGNKVDLSKYEFISSLVKCEGVVSETPSVQFSVSSDLLQDMAEGCMFMYINISNSSIIINELDSFDDMIGKLTTTFNEWSSNIIFGIISYIANPETWELNETLTGDYNFNVNVDFIVDNRIYSSITVETNEDGITVMYDEEFVYNDVGSGIWEYNTYRTIEFYDEVTDETLLTWLQENGVKQ